MKRNWIRKLIGGLSFTSALFVFQACYGTPQDFGQDFLLEGRVTSKTSGLPIEGIKVSVADEVQYFLTDTDGRFSFYTARAENKKILFEDIDSTQNGQYANMDTVLKEAIPRRVFLNINMADN